MPTNILWLRAQGLELAELQMQRISREVTRKDSITNEYIRGTVERRRMVDTLAIDVED